MSSRSPLRIPPTVLSVYLTSFLAAWTTTSGAIFQFRRQKRRAMGGISMKTKRPSHTTRLVLTTVLAAAVMAPVHAIPGGYSVAGTDVSNNDGSIRWNELAGAGIKFGWAKATEGVGYVDPNFNANYRDAKTYGIYIGAYAFGRPDNGPGTGKEQADFLVDNAQYANDGKTLPLQLDIEWPYWQGNPGACYGLSQDQMVRWIRDFVDEVQARTGRPAAIYTNTQWWKQCTGNNASFGGNPLEIANYDGAPGALPAGWSTFTAWQYAGKIPPLPGSGTVFNGDLKALAQFAAGGVVPEPTTSYGITTNGLKVRGDNNSCRKYPSSANCSPVVDTMKIGDRIMPNCQKAGQTVGSNPYWVYGRTTHNKTGWIPSWWIDYPDNVLPGVPICADGKYWVDTFADAAGYRSVKCMDNDSPYCRPVGKLNAGRNYVYCKKRGDQVSDSRGNHNYWWLKTDLDVVYPGGSSSAWVSAYYLSRWGNNEVKDNKGVEIPNCN